MHDTLHFDIHFTTLSLISFSPCFNQ
jgi:hypothetical protein